MLKRISNWYNEWEQEQLDVLANPALAEQAPPGYRRFVARKLAELSPIEREQLRAFAVKYRERTLWLAIAKLVAAFSVLGFVIHLTKPARIGIGEGLFLGNLLGFACVMILLGIWFNYNKITRNKAKAAAILMGSAMLGAITGAAVAMTMDGRSAAYIMEKLPPLALKAGLSGGIAMTIPMLVVAALRSRYFEMRTERLQSDAERASLAREVSESKLRLLRAQIEPHFLFNTLGAVQQLAEQGAPRAAELTANLIAFLRASMTEMRSEQVSLVAEFGLVEAYLKVMKARMADRLHFQVTLPAELEQVKVPTMLLLTLVENAIKHGIEPSLRGGEVRVSASGENGSIRIRVEDTGVGMSSNPGAGEGLENVRRRLQLAHGDAASLWVRNSGEQGVVAEVVLPVSVAAEVTA